MDRTLTSRGTEDRAITDRAGLAERIATLREQGVCPTCHDLRTGELFADDDRLVFEDDRFKVVLERYPRMPGHTIVVYKPHREDISELSDDEAGDVMKMCLRVTRALKAGLGAEKVYLNTMCDGVPNHLHLQLFPRYAGDDVGSGRFVLPRGEVADAGGTAALVRGSL